jgi:hypothetical protein
MITCDNCRHSFDPLTTPHYELFCRTTTPSTVCLFRYCSISCLSEYSWTLRDQQPKLSKSHMEPYDPLAT